MLTFHPLEKAIPFYKSQGCIENYTDEFEDEVESMFIDIWHKESNS